MSHLHLAGLHSAGFTHKDLEKIFTNHENYREFFDICLAGGVVDLPWMTDERRAKILDKIQKIDLQKLGDTIEAKQIQCITLHSDIYPTKLRDIKQHPYLLYVRGNLHDMRRMLGIVGSRRSTSYGKKILENYIPALVAAGCGIVSGGAYGIDAISHEITLSYEGYTISVFGCGVDIVYPVQNTGLFEKILAAGGALISMFPIGTEAEPYMFPMRNEIVAALSDGIIIPEAGIKSGTLITAALALEHGRDVFAVPGDIFRETSQGCNNLIARGEAKCIQQVTDILEEYFPTVPTETLSLWDQKSWNSPEEKDIYQAIIDGYDTPDSIGQNTSYSIDQIIMTLSLLEIEGHIRLGNRGKYEVI